METQEFSFSMSDMIDPGPGPDAGAGPDGGLDRQSTRILRPRAGDPAAEVLKAALTVHKALGPGLPAAFYRRALGVQLTLQGQAFAEQVPLTLRYRDQPLGLMRAHLLLQNLVVQVEPRLEAAEESRLRRLVRASRRPLGLLLCFQQEELEARRVPR